MGPLSAAEDSWTALAESAHDHLPGRHFLPSAEAVEGAPTGPDDLGSVFLWLSGPQFLHL